jgi:dihydropteroate synthase
MHSIYQSSRPLVMGILNVTPDSFSDGGRFIAPQKAIERARTMIEAGVDIIDIGGESTRPGAAAVTIEDELQRVIPVIEAVAPLGKPVSVDTSKPEVMLAAVEAGASMINDVCALQMEGALAAAVECQVPVCLMHMQGSPRTMQQNPCYTQVVNDVFAFLQQRVAACIEAGLPRELLSIDPGFGFGKRLEHNLQLLSELSAFEALQLPILVGISRKSMLGEITGKPIEQRTAASVAAAVIAAERGANIIRVHDVEETVDALKVWTAVRDYQTNLTNH